MEGEVVAPAPFPHRVLYLEVGRDGLPCGGIQGDAADRQGLGLSRPFEIMVTPLIPKVSSNCLESQWELARDLVAGWFQDEPYSSMEFRIFSGSHIQAV